ncbi:P-loop containing nucleoside triphosphate hydrolase protein [Melanogaster broomeanus]|nr:P-loop containing nucleoside triphosphate hydrolase protein [Melanogaster broomeanus]
MIPKSVRNIVVAGETGVGKSSLINLVIGSDSAPTANTVIGVTLGTACYDWKIDNTSMFRLWDTPGLGEGSFGKVSPRQARGALRSLLKELNKGTGVHLLIICMRGTSRVPKGTKLTYDTILTIRNEVSPEIPVIAVITELEKISTSPDIISSMDAWWTKNSGQLSTYEMAFSGHACLTTLTDDCYPCIEGRRDLCQRLVHELIRNHSLQPRAVPSKDLHVMLFGETGVGKSSLINLLAGWQIADVSPNADGCTMHSTEYQFQLGSTTIRLWDTVGLGEPEKGVNSYVGAIEKSIQLIQRLNATGGISLFLFCIRGNRISATTQRNYRLFYEILGKKEVPIALAVTYLEREVEMEDWWHWNVNMLERNGILTAGHACITTLEGHQKYQESREVMLKLLSQYEDQQKFSMPSEDWIAVVLNGLVSLVGNCFPRGRDLTRILMKRCQLEADVAQHVAACIQSN